MIEVIVSFLFLWLAIGCYLTCDWVKSDNKIVMTTLDKSRKHKPNWLTIPFTLFLLAMIWPVILYRSK